HTWGQNLAFHPHVHCLVPGGGLSKDGLRFILSRKKFFIPVKVISRKFKGKFLFYLEKAWSNGEIRFYNSCEYLTHGVNFLNLISSLRIKDWVVYCKKPFNSPWYVVSYLGRYTHRVAIANSRLVNFNGSTVSFKWKDYKDHNRVKLMTLEAKEFVRRFLLHVLPSGFTRIRHYGLLASKHVGTKLVRCIKLAGIRVVVPRIIKHVNTCALCGGVMTFASCINRPLPEP
ncbi:MAG: IS91 family transposase, partial [Carboxydocellales bacterium]